MKCFLHQSRCFKFLQKISDRNPNHGGGPLDIHTSMPQKTLDTTLHTDKNGAMFNDYNKPISS